MVAGVEYVAGIALAVVAAVAFALYYLCIRLGTDDGEVLDVMLVSLLVNVALTVPLALLVYGVPELTLRAAFSFALAGISGSLLARLVVIKSVETIGASRTSPVVAANVLVASLFAVVLFDEQVSGPHLLGIVLVVAGVGAITWETADVATDSSLRSAGLALFLPILGALFIGVEPIFITVGLEDGGAILPGVAIKALAATVGFVLYLWLADAARAGMVRWNPNTKWYLGAGVTSTASIVTYFAALELAPVVLVVPLTQTAPLLVVVLSALFLPRRLERVSLRLVLGALVVVAGATLVSVYA